MPSWGDILNELKQRAEVTGQLDFDGVRRNYLTALHQRTGRETIVYYTDFISGRFGGPEIAITLEDVQAMMEVCRGLQGPELNIILHSPGGSPEATDSIVRYLRTKFEHIRVFVPIAAMSAATMWALAADVIVMGKHSQLGPIDPQLVGPFGTAPARAVLRQFDQAVSELTENPAKMPAWMPILQQYGPALLQQCEAAEQLGKELVTTWLTEFMFRGDPDAAEHADQVANYFSAYDQHQSHSRGIGRDTCKNLGVRLEDLEEDQELQDAVLSVHHAALLTLDGPAVKLVENHLGRAFVKMGQLQVLAQLPVPPPSPPSPPSPG